MRRWSGNSSAGVEQRRTHALARLAHGGVREAHDREHGQPAAEVYLDGDLAAVDALEGEGGDACEHTAKLGRRASRVGYTGYDSATGW